MPSKSCQFLEDLSPGSCWKPWTVPLTDNGVRHRIWYSPKGMRISIQTRGNRAKGYQVEQFLKVYEEESSNDG